jgi:hypothetical protein
MLDEKLHGAFIDAVQDAPPQTSDPYDRLMLRTRRRRQTRLVLSGAGLVAAALAALIVVPAARPTSTGSVAYAGDPVMSDWARKLIASPTRGDLTNDEDYVAEVAKTAARRRAAWQVAPDLTSVKVLYAGDETGSRVALLVFFNADRAVFVWFSAPKGATAAVLVARPTVSNELEPFATVSYDNQPYEDKAETRFTLGLAPAGCQIDSSTDAAHQAWLPVPTKSFAALDTVASADWWRVTCDGVVHYQGPATGHVGVYTLPPVTDAQLTAALADARGTADRDVARFALRHLAPGAGPVLTTDASRVLWGGSVPGLPSSHTVVAAAPLGNGNGWYVTFETSNGKATNDATSSSLTSFSVGTRVALDDPRSLFGLRPADARSNPTDQILVLAPQDAASAVAIDANGTPVAKTSLTNGTGWLTAIPQTPVTLQALNAHGAVIASYTVDSPADRSVVSPAPTINNW